MHLGPGVVLSLGATGSGERNTWCCRTYYVYVSAELDLSLLRQPEYVDDTDLAGDVARRGRMGVES